MRTLILFDIDGTLVRGGPAKVAFETAMLETYGTAGAVESSDFSGKTDPQGRPLLRAEGVLDPSEVRAGLVRRLQDLGRSDPPLDARAEALALADERAQGLSMVAARPAYFCSGCPHNRSTQVPEGSSAMGATGCHGLAHYMPGRRTMQTVGMGSEGTPWIAAQHFVDTPHYFQNLGDGTYTHSGLLAIRASVAAKSAVTYKILYNDAVAMTGGQPMEGGLTPQQIVREMVTEGVDPVVVVSEAPEAFAREGLPGKVRVLHRDELERVQRDLREVKGTSAILYEQTCANEKRRRRKRGQLADPDRRLFINAEVCEGCGGDHPSPRGPLHKPDPQQKRLNLVLDRLGDNVHTVCDRLHPGRSASEYGNQRFQILAVLRFQTDVVNLEHPKRFDDHLMRNVAVGLNLRKVA